MLELFSTVEEPCTETMEHRRLDNVRVCSDHGIRVRYSSFTANGPDATINLCAGEFASGNKALFRDLAFRLLKEILKNTNHSRRTISISASISASSAF